MQDVLSELALWNDVLIELSNWIARGDRTALATVVDTQRSAPRPRGRQDGRQRVRRDRRRGVGRVRRGSGRGDRRSRDAGRHATAGALRDSRTPTRGMWDCHAAARSTSGCRRTSRAGSRRSRRDGGRAAEVTLMEGAAPGAKLLIEADGARSGTLGAPELDDEAVRVADELLWTDASARRGAMFVDVVAPPPRLHHVRRGRPGRPRCARSRGTPDGGPTWSTRALDSRLPTGSRTPSR